MTKLLVQNMKLATVNGTVNVVKSVRPVTRQCHSTTTEQQDGRRSPHRNAGDRSVYQRRRQVSLPTPTWIEVALKTATRRQCDKHTAALRQCSSSQRDRRSDDPTASTGFRRVPRAAQGGPQTIRQRRRGSGEYHEQRRRTTDDPPATHIGATIARQ